MKNQALFIVLALLLVTTSLLAQNNLSEADSTQQAIAFDTLRKLPVNLGYEQLAAQASPFAVEQIGVDNFNQGLVTDPSLLVQGKMAGVQIYNRGGDPNLWSLIRVRGISSLSQRQPLILIDGVPGAALEALDPNDVASITVLKDGSAQALYGIRASNGVVLITTKSAQPDAGPSFSYQGQVASSQAYDPIPVLDANSFVAAGGYDLGSNTNWLDAVQRSGFSRNHSLAASGTKGKSSFRLSGNYRNVEGVLQKSGFEQLNVRANLQTRALNDRLKVDLNAAYTDRTSQLGFQEAFHYAVQANPTAPIFAANAPFPFSPTQYGGYFEFVGLFDAFNPVSLLNLNDRNTKDQVFMGSAFLQYELASNINVNFRYAYQDHFQNERAYYSPQSLFRGYALSPADSLRGTADLYDLNESLSLYELFINYGANFDKLKLDFTLGTSYTDGRSESEGLSLRGFASPDLLTNRRIEDYTTWNNEATVLDTLGSGWSTKYSAFFGRMQLSIADLLYLHASLRSEGSSRLGEKWNAFSAFGVALDLSSKSARFDLLKFRLGYGVTGAVPDQPGLTSERVETIIGTDGTTTTNILRQANPGLFAEQKQEVNLGFDIGTPRVRAAVDYYSRRVSDWITPGPLQFPTQYVNAANAIKSNGFELSLDAIVHQGSQASYTTGLRVATYNARYDELEFETLGISSSCCNSGTPIIVGAAGEQVGEILAPVFTGIDEQGNAIFADLNGDGQVLISEGFAYNPEGDLAVVGNGLPSLELGWFHQYRYGQWEVHAFFRGAFGHSLFNQFRLRQEASASLNRQANYVNTELAIDGLRFSVPSDLYVEKANFVKLDYLTLARTFPLRFKGSPVPLRISLTAQNLLLASSYTGPDPEPALEQLLSLTNGQQASSIGGNPLGPGIDRRTHYLPAQTYSLGVSLRF